MKPVKPWNKAAVTAGCVWDVAWLKNGDLVTGCADYVARVWSAAPKRQAPAEARDAYAASLQASTSGMAEFKGLGFRVP